MPQAQCDHSSDLVNRMYSASVEQDPFRQGCLSGIYVSRNSNVSHIHKSISFFYVRLRQSAKVSEACQLLPTAKPHRLTGAGSREISVYV